MTVPASSTMSTAASTARTPGPLSPRQADVVRVQPIATPGTPVYPEPVRQVESDGRGVRARGAGAKAARAGYAGDRPDRQGPVGISGVRLEGVACPTRGRPTENVAHGRAFPRRSGTASMNEGCGVPWASRATERSTTPTCSSCRRPDCLHIPATPARCRAALDGAGERCHPTLASTKSSQNSPQD